MSQGQDWNAPGGQAYPQQPPGEQAYPQQPPPGQPYPQGPDGTYGLPGMAPGMPVPPGFYYDQLSGLTLPEGTALASVGRRIGAYFLGALLSIVTLGIGYVIWGLIAWGKGQTPAQMCLGLQTWRPQERVNASWGTMFLRGFAYLAVGWIPFAQLVSFILFLSGKEHRTLHDSIASTIVLHDPNKVLQRQVQYQPVA
ncbi:MAG: RDD family protein [Trebonia sp.]